MPTLDQLKRRHYQHRQSCDYWTLLQAMMDGGSKLTPELKQKLLVNPDRRPDSVVKERVKVARYFNKISPIAGRFVSQLFAAPIQFEGSKDKFWEETFFPGGALLPQTEDDGRATFNAFLKAALWQALAQQKAIAQIDTAIATESRNRKEQRERREDEPYVLLVPRSELWDWETDRNGFKFAKLCRFSWQRDNWDSDPTALHDFTIYQRKPDGSVVVSRYSVSHADKKGSDFDKGMECYSLDRLDEKEAKIEVVNNLEERPIFHVGKDFKFPIVTLTLPSSLWLADQLHDPQVSHFNQTASLEYGLVASNYAMPTVETQDIEDFSDRNKKWGEGFYLHLDPSQQEKIGWTERPGNSFSTSMEYRSTVEADIDKQVQQIAIAAEDAATAASGETLKQARKPEEILMLLLGQHVKDFAKSVLDVAAIAHGETVNWQVSGMEDFDSINPTALAQEMALVSQAQIPSQTFQKEYQKAFIRAIAKEKDFDSKLLKTMLEEIDQAEPPEPETSEGEATGSEGQPEEDSTVDDLLNDPSILEEAGL